MGYGNSKLNQSSEDIQEQLNYGLIIDQQNLYKDLYVEVKEKINQDDLHLIVTGKNEEEKKGQMIFINVDSSTKIKKYAKSKITKIKRKSKKKISNTNNLPKRYDSSWTLHFKKLKKNLIETKSKNKILIKRKCFEKLTTYKFIKKDKIKRKAYKIRIILPERKIKKIVSLISLINRIFLRNYQRPNIISRNENNYLNTKHTINSTINYTINNDINSIDSIEEFNDLDDFNHIEEEKDYLTPNVISIISSIEIINDIKLDKKKKDFNYETTIK